MAVHNDDVDNIIPIFCDGTWCGEATGTYTNIKYLSEYFKKVINSSNEDSGYFQGIGSNAFFVGEYLVNGGMALDLKYECVRVYKHVVKKYNEAVGLRWHKNNPNTISADYSFFHFSATSIKRPKIWFFGLSRGAYIVRCVARMINNLGILRYDSEKVEKMVLEGVEMDSILDLVCGQVFDRYENGSDEWKPGGKESQKFWKEHCFELSRDPQPVEFMGLLDTVGSVGVPEHPLSSCDYPYDTKFDEENISPIVQNVFQILCIHDRLKFFQPIPIKRSIVYVFDGDLCPYLCATAQDDGCTEKAPHFHYYEPTSPESECPLPGCKLSNLSHRHELIRLKEGECFPCWLGSKCTTTLGLHDHNLVTEEIWAPGCHYDVGRQYFRLAKLTAVQKFVLSLFLGDQLLPPQIFPNHELSDLALNWMIEKIIQTFHNKGKQICQPTKIWRYPYLQFSNEPISNRKVILSNDIYEYLVEEKYDFLKRYYILKEREMPFQAQYIWPDHTHCSGNHSSIPGYPSLTLLNAQKAKGINSSNQTQVTNYVETRGPSFFPIVWALKIIQFSKEVYFRTREKVLLPSMVRDLLSDALDDAEQNIAYLPLTHRDKSERPLWFQHLERAEAKQLELENLVENKRSELVLQQNQRAKQRKRNAKMSFLERKLQDLQDPLTKPWYLRELMIFGYTVWDRYINPAAP